MSAAQLSKARTAGALALIWLHANTVCAQLPDYSGRAVVDLIEALRDAGRRIAYSGELVPSRLRVTVAPSSDDPLEALREILAVHELDVELGPRDTWLIVRNEAAVAETPAAGNASAVNRVPPRLETIIVTASRYPIARRVTSSASSFERHTLETTPALGQDPLRVIHRLPGVTSDQLTSETHIRGGNLDEVLLRIDGIRLYSPYHLKDFQNIFSSINSRIVESMEVRTGGFEARYGDRMSGVVDLNTIRPEEFRHHEVGVSFLDTSVLSSGLFSNGRGAWVTSLRRGNLDVLADAGNSDFGTPQYVDFFNKIEFDFSPKFGIETGILSLDDKISLKDGVTVSAAADYDDIYYWLTLNQLMPSGLEASYRISVAGLNRTRSGRIDDPDRLTGLLSEQSRFDRTALTADWSYQLFDSVLVEWGAEYASMDTRHRFESSRSNLAAITASQLDGPNNPPGFANIRLEQAKRSIYASFRYQVLRRLITEFGVRWDAQSLIGDQQTSPRLNMRFDVTDRTRVRASWGEFAQSDSLNELDVADGFSSLQPANESRHSILGLEHRFGATGLLRIEVYRKNVTRLASRFENVFERVSLLPELLPDRFMIEPSSAVTRGAEISIEGNVESFGWWANMTFAHATERLASGTYKRSWDERRSIKTGGEWTGPKWNVTATLGYRTGWPISKLSPVNGALSAENFNGTGLPDFSSIDIRASRSVDVSNGDLEWFIEVSNLADHANYCCLDYELIPGNGTDPDRLSLEYDELLGIVPNIGLRWTF